MNFQPELAAKVMAGEKTVTRRRMSGNPRSPWYRGRCSLVVGRRYAVCPGRTKNAIGHVVVTGVRTSIVGYVGDSEAILEGFRSRAEFIEAWKEINGELRPLERVWRVSFRAVEPDGGGT